MIRAVKRLILRSIERAGYIVLKRDDSTIWNSFGRSRLHHNNSISSASGRDARTAAQLQALARELISAREAAVRAERELEKARAKLWQLREINPQGPSCSTQDGTERSPAIEGEVSSGTAPDALRHAPR